MKILKKLSRYSAMATGDFKKIFKGFEVPACPQVAMRLMEAARDPEATVAHVASIIEADPGLGSAVLRMVNSAVYGIPATVGNISKAVSLVGLKEIEALAMAYAVKQAVPTTGREAGFDMDLFWSDSILRALFARQVAGILGQEPEDAFVGGLMQDIALPVLLGGWFDIYEPVFRKWKATGLPLDQVEERMLNWNHCQAGAWIARSWKLPDLLVCCVGLHNYTVNELDEMGLVKTAVAAVSLSSRVPVALRMDDGGKMLVMEADRLGISTGDLKRAALGAEEGLGDMTACFGVSAVERPSLVTSIEALDGDAGRRLGS